jgi:hypothetical protein
MSFLFVVLTSLPVRGNRFATASAEISSPAWSFFAGLLLAARYLQPTEAVVFGETLWQAQLWLVGAALWCWSSFRSGRRSLSFSPLDGLVAIIVVGHALSTIPVFLEGGDRRGAVNVVWEWAGLAATVFLVRQLLPSIGRSRLVTAFAGMMVGIAALGIWQHHVSFPETAARYDLLTSTEAQLSKRIADGNATSSERRQFDDVRRKLGDFGIPADAAARRQLESRIKFSSEPFGTFGLTNTLGGLLAAALPILLSCVSWRDRTWRGVGVLAAIGIVFYCLLLTKSRTAWVGLAAGGLGAIALHSVRGKVDRRIMYAIAAMLIAVLVAGAAVLASGGLDREVLSEAPKSLRYRLDYWTGALEVLRERPILGTGPVNFRSYYLEHRPIGASEEIAAPHNLFLDIWTAGGLISLLALVGLLVYAAWCLLRSRSSHEPAKDAIEVRPSWSAFEIGTFVAFPVVFLVFFVSGSGFDWRLAGIAAVAAAALLCLNRSNASAANIVGLGAGFAALSVHLLGADGIELPAVVQTLLIYVLCIEREGERAIKSTGVLAGAGVLTLLAAGCLLTGLTPVLNAGALMSRAEAALREGDPSADRLLGEAIAADPLALTARRMQAELATSRARSTGRAADLVTARREWDSILSDEPRSIADRTRLAALLLDLADGDLKRQEEAVTLLSEAVRLSPTDAELRVRLARAALAAGDSKTAAEQAEEALTLDRINTAEGHTDILLDESTRREMERLSAVGNPRPAP